MSELGLRNLSVQLNQNCNFACAHCGFQSSFRGTEGNRPVHMPPELFTSIVDEYRELEQQEQKMVSLAAGGEPLLHPSFIELCDYVNQCDVGFGFDTNASLLTPDVSQDLLSMRNFKRIVFSVDSLEPETYAAIRVGGTLEKVRQNVLDFLRLAKWAGREDIHTRVNFVEQFGNQHEVDDFIRYWTLHVSQVNVIQQRLGTRVPRPHWLPEKRMVCGFLYNHMRILTDGTVVVCCVDDTYESVIASVASSGLTDIWRGPEYESLRARQRAGDFSTPAICRDCNCWAGFLAPRAYRHLQSDIAVGERPLGIVARRLDRPEYRGD